MDNSNERHIDYASAFSTLYKRSKLYKIVDIFFVWAAFFFPLIVYFKVDSQYKFYVFFFGLFWLGLNFIFKKLRSEDHKKAVNIHEQYDCNTLQINWNEDLAGKKVSELDIISYTKNKQITNNDYATQGEKTIPAKNKTLLSMLENFFFEKNNRKIFNNIVLILLLLYYASLFVFAFLQKYTCDIFIAAYLAPTFAFLKYYYSLLVKSQKLYKKQTTTFDKINKALENNKQKDTEITNEQIRNFQDEVYNYRAEDLGIPSWLYRLTKKKRNRVFKKYLNHYTNVK